MKGKQSRKIGILGGTFNPIHVGHLILAQNALEYCGLEKVLIMPSGCSYFKDPETIADTAHRIKMVELAIEDNDCFELSTIETDRDGNSYTYETLDILCRDNPDVSYYYIIGADTLLYMDTWKNPGDIFSKCTVVCAKRDGLSDTVIDNKVRFLKEQYDADIVVMDCGEIGISSTGIRERLLSKKSLKYYINDKVIRYIKENGLYGINSN